MKKLRLHPFFTQNKIAFLSLGLIVSSLVVGSSLTGANPAIFKITSDVEMSKTTGASCIQTCVNKGGTAYDCAVNQCGVNAVRPSPKTDPYCARTCPGNQFCEPDANGGHCVRDVVVPSPKPSLRPSPKPSPDQSPTGPKAGNSCNNDSDCWMNEVCKTVAPGKKQCQKVEGTCSQVDHESCGQGNVCAATPSLPQIFTCQPKDGSKNGKPCFDAPDYWYGNGSTIDIPKQCVQVNGNETGSAYYALFCKNGTWVPANVRTNDPDCSNNVKESSSQPATNNRQVSLEKVINFIRAIF